MSFVKDAVCGDTIVPEQTNSLQSGGRYQSPTANIISKTSENIKSSLKRDVQGGGKPPMPAEKRIFPQSQSMREPTTAGHSNLERSNEKDTTNQSSIIDQAKPPADKGLLNRRRKL